MRSATFGPRLRRAALGLLVPLALGVASAPIGCSNSNAPADAGAPAFALTPVPAPDGLVAELFLPTPDATWTKARGMVGGPAAFLPQNFAVLAITLLKLPATAAGEFDGNVPVLGAIVKKGEGPATGSIGLHVKSGDRLIDQLTKGAEARYEAKLDEATRITWITRKDGDTTITIGVLGNYVLVGRSQADVIASGPYVARTLPTRAAPREDLALEIPEAALGPTIAEGARRQWTRAAESLERSGATLLPIAGPVNAALDVIGDAKQGRVTLTLDPGAAHVRVTLAPKPGGGPASKAIAEMTVGDAKPLLELPASTTVGLLFRDAAKTRAARADAQADAIAKVLAKDMPADDKASLAAALRAESEARGEWTALGISLAATGATAALRAPVADEGQMQKALKQLLELGRLPSVKARLDEAKLSLKIGKTVVENLAGDVTRVRFERVEKDKKDDKAAKDKKPAKDEKAPKNAGAIEPPLPGTIDLVYLITKGTLFGAAGQDPAEALRTVVKGEPNLGGDAAIQRAIEALGGDASFTLLVDPLRALAARAGRSAPAEAAPVVLALGRTGAEGELWVRLDMPAPVIQELVRLRGAL